MGTRAVIESAAGLGRPVIERGRVASRRLGSSMLPRLQNLL